MNKTSIKIWINVVLLLLSVSFASCTSMSTDLRHQNEADDVSSGPGLFSGEEGKVVIFRK